MELSTKVRDLLGSMSLAQKIGQVFVFTWKNPAQAQNDLRLYPGGYIRIFGDVLSVSRDSAGIQENAHIPLIIAADFERGIGGTIGGAIEVVQAMALGAARDAQAAFDAGQMIGREARLIGVNMDYAPVLDVNSNPRNPVINTRSFGSDPEIVALLAVEFMRGLQSAGVASCGKHFPGHGNTHVDSHSQLGTVLGSIEDLDNMELKPFRAAIAAGIDAIMSAHLHVPAVEPGAIPATLSRNVMTGLLRDRLQFQGVAVTDALDMGAIARNFAPEEVIPMAVNAGCDQLIMPHDPEFVVDVLTAAISRGDVSEDRLNEAVARILTLKERRGILSQTSSTAASVCQQINSVGHVARAQEIADQSITAVKNDGAVPLRIDDKILCLDITNWSGERSIFLEPHSFPDHLASGGWHVCSKNMPYPARNLEPWADDIRQQASRYDVVVLAMYAVIQLSSGNIGFSPEIIAAVNQAMGWNDGLQPRVVIASFGSPYVLGDFSRVNAALCAFSQTQASQRAMARALRGVIPAAGQLPVKL